MATFPLLFIIAASFMAGAITVIVAFLIIEHRVYSRPGIKAVIAAEFLDDYAREIGGAK